MVRPIIKDEMKENIQEQLEEHSEQLQQLGERIGETARKFSRATNDYVQENPWKTIGIAAGIGFVLGAIFLRSRDE